MYRRNSSTLSHLLPSQSSFFATTKVRCFQQNKFIKSNESSFRSVHEEEGKPEVDTSLICLSLSFMANMLSDSPSSLEAMLRYCSPIDTWYINLTILQMWRNSCLGFAVRENNSVVLVKRGYWSVRATRSIGFITRGTVPPTLLERVLQLQHLDLHWCFGSIRTLRSLVSSLQETTSVFQNGCHGAKDHRYYEVKVDNSLSQLVS